MSIQHERALAIREGEEIAAEDDYFDARPGILNSREARKIFQDAFKRGWDRNQRRIDAQTVKP